MKEHLIIDTNLKKYKLIAYIYIYNTTVVIFIGLILIIGNVIFFSLRLLYQYVIEMENCIVHVVIKNNFSCRCRFIL